MKCRICGYEANPGVKNCPMCGSQLPEDLKYAGVSESPKRAFFEDTDLSWNTKDFPKPKELHDIKMRWTMSGMDPEEGGAMMTGDATEGYAETPAPKKEVPAAEPELPKFELPKDTQSEKSTGTWNMPLWYTQNEGVRPFTASGYIKVQPNQDDLEAQLRAKKAQEFYDDVKAPEVSPFPEMPKEYEAPETHVEPASYDIPKFEEVPVAVPQEEKVVDEAWLAEELAEAHQEEPKEQFPTFVRKNEEFQKLLNREYERANSMNAVPAGEELRRTHSNVFGSEESIQVESLSAFEQMLLEGTEDGDSEKTLILSREKSAEPAAAPAPAEKPYDPLDSMPKNTLSGTGSLSWSKMLDEMEAEQARSRAEKEAAAAEKKATLAEAAAAPAPQQEEFPKPVDSIELKGEDHTVTLNKNTIELKLAEMRQRHENEKGSRSERRQKLDSMAKAREEYFKLMNEEQSAPAEAEAAPEASEDQVSDKLDKVFTQEYKESAPEKTSAKEKKKKKKADDDFMKPERHNGFLIFLLIIALICGLAYGAYWGVNKYMPDTPAAAIINQGAEDLLKLKDQAIDKINDLIAFYTGEKKIDENEKLQDFTTDNLTEAEIAFEKLVKAADPDGIIKDVSVASRLHYSENKEYKNKNLAEMQVVTEKNEKNAIYLTMIGYNASWVKFVNEGDSACLDYLKADGSAYRSAINYELIGEITEEFNNLELGEIRTDGSYFYVFDAEDVSITMGEDTTNAKSEMLYRLEKIGSKYVIVDYTEL